MKSLKLEQCNVKRYQQLDLALGRDIICLSNEMIIVVMIKKI